VKYDGPLVSDGQVMLGLFVAFGKLLIGRVKH